MEAPVIDLCPRDIKIISKEKVPKLILPGVKVTDNVGVDHFVTSIKNGSKVTVGQHLITYTATDKAGNKAYCRFRMTITGTNNFKASSRDHNLEHQKLPYIHLETNYFTIDLLQTSATSKLLQYCSIYIYFFSVRRCQRFYQ